MFNAIFRIFMKITGVDRKILGNPGVRQAMKDTAKAGILVLYINLKN